MKVIGNFKQGINNSLKEIQKNKGKQVESLIEETHKFLKEIQKNTSNRVKELSKTI
jgi:flagellar motility protein MotE (MotC chaperone)